MTTKFFCFITAFFLLSKPAFTQNGIVAADSGKPLNYVDFYGLVIQNHPVVKLADLEIDNATAELMQARGAFDPKLSSTFDRKSINGKDYYNKWLTELKVPVWGGIDVKVGREQNNGYRLTPELTEGVSTYAGINIPLGQGLILEERRNTLRQVQIYQQIAEAERQKIINKIIYAAAKDYWEWYLAYQIIGFNKEGLELARNNFEFTRTQVQIGEKAGVDSLEAKINLQTRIVAYKYAVLDFKNATLKLSNYLWTPQNQPVELSESVVPAEVASFEVDALRLQQLLASAQTNHPDIQKLDFKNDQLVIQEQFQRELLKPRFDVSYSAISVPKYNLSEYGIIKSNSKLGLVFEMPLLLRKERGKLQQVRVKQLQLFNDRRQLSREITTDVLSAFNTLTNLSELLTIQNEVTRNQKLLMAAEREKFRIGESSLFLINSRESKLIEQNVKLAELKAKYEKALAELIFSSGRSSLP